MRPYPADPFRNSRTVFEAAVEELSDGGTATIDHAEREREARPAAVRGAEGIERTEVRASSRPLGMLCGGVVVHRLAFVKHGASGGLRPLDAHLNLPRGLYSQGV